MKTEQLKYFLDIAQSRSISRTAERYYISQQAVSDAMKRLEDEFCCKLLRRRRNGVALTEAGEIFLPEARKMMASYHKMQLRLNPKYQEGNLFQGKIHLDVHPRMYHLGFKEFLNHFMGKYPNIKISLMEGDNRQIHEAVTGRQADIGVLFGRGIYPEGQPLVQEGLCEQVLYSDCIYICFARPHRLAEAEPIALKELGNYDVTSFASQSFIDSYFSEQPNRRANVYFCNDVDTQCDLIKSGTAAGVLTAYERQRFFREEDQVIARPVEERADILLIFWPQAREDAVLAAFCAEAAEYYRDWGELGKPLL